MAVYKKDRNTSYRYMFDYIDQHIYDENPDYELIYKYLYLIIKMKSQRGSFFRTAYDYDTFSIITASNTLLRYLNKDLDKIFCISAYLNKILYLEKVKYQQKEYRDDKEINGFVDPKYISDFNYNVTKYLDCVNQLDRIDFEVSLPRVYLIVKNVVDSTFYCNNEIERKNIYISCLLTLIEELTIRTKRNFDDLGEKINQQIYDKPILYHCNDNMENLIRTLVIIARREIVKNLSYKSQSLLTSDSLMKYAIDVEYEGDNNGSDEIN